MPLLNVRVHLQDDPTACALACAQMVLRKITNTLHQQVPLRPGSKDGVWLTSPNQLRTILNNRLAGTAAEPHYQVFAEQTLDQAMERAAAALAASFPAIALTSSAEHWVVLHGLTTTSSAVTIHVRNPLPDREDVMATPLPAHTVNDICRDKDLMDCQDPGGETASGVEWADDYMFPSQHAPVAGKFVVLAPLLPMISGGRYPALRRKPPSIKMILARQASGLAWSGLAEADLLSQPEWRNLRDESILDSERVVRVERTDHGKSPYFIVHLETRKGVSALARISEASGELQAALLQPSKRLTESLFDSLEQLRALHTCEPESTARLVWQYSRATFFSPFVPALEVRTPGSHYFVRLYDGKRFDTLDDHYAAL